MNRRGLIVSAVALLGFADLSCAKPSDEMRAFLKERQAGKHDVRVDGLVRLEWTRQEAERAREHDDWEAHEIPFPKSTADYFQYTVLRLRTGKSAFVVIRSGGIAGVLEILGTKKISPPLPAETRD